jgi:hypothetical protein
VNQTADVIDATAVDEDWDDLFGAQSAPQLPAPPRPDAYAAYVSLAKAGGGRGDPARLQKLAIRIGELTGEDGFYNFPMGGSRIEGPTIKLAKALANKWGSVGFGVEIDEIETDRVYLTGVCVDFLELVVVRRGSSFALSPAPKKFASTPENKVRWETMQVQSGGSRALRGAILDCLPSWFVDPAFQAAKAAAAKGGLKPGQSIEQARAEAVKVFAGMKVTREQVEAIVGSPIVEWSLSDLFDLRALIRSVRDGETTMEEVIASVGTTATTPDPATGRLDSLGLGKPATTATTPPPPSPTSVTPTASQSEGAATDVGQRDTKPATPKPDPVKEADLLRERIRLGGRWPVGGADARKHLREALGMARMSDDRYHAAIGSGVERRLWATDDAGTLYPASLHPDQPNTPAKGMGPEPTTKYEQGLAELDKAHEKDLGPDPWPDPGQPSGLELQAAIEDCEAALDDDIVADCARAAGLPVTGDGPVLDGAPEPMRRRYLGQLRARVSL